MPDFEFYQSDSKENNAKMFIIKCSNFKVFYDLLVTHGAFLRFYIYFFLRIYCHFPLILGF